MLPWAQNHMCPKPKIQTDQLQRNFDHYCLSWQRLKSVDDEKICKEILYVQGGILILNHEIVGNKISNITSEMYSPEILPEMIE